jgi:hypothetical protein
MVREWRKFALCAVVLLAVPAAGACHRVPSARSKNEPPFGVVDGPPNGAIVGREVEFSGWALDDSRVAEVKIYVDGHYQKSAKLKIPRPDVTSAYPRYPASGNIHGWWELVDLGERGGAHTLRAEAVDDRGAASDIGSVTITLIDR